MSEPGMLGNVTQNSAPNQGAERPSAAQFLFPNEIIVPGAAHFPSFSRLCPEISQSCPDFCPDCESCPDEISSKPAMFFSLDSGHQLQQRPPSFS